MIIIIKFNNTQAGADALDMSVGGWVGVLYTHNEHLFGCRWQQMWCAYDAGKVGALC